MTAPPAPLAQFIDRYTLRYERFYRHPIERVWQAVTEPDEMDRWMLPLNRSDRKLGGAWANLGSLLDGTLGPTWRPSDGPHPTERGDYDPDWLALIELYRAHIAHTIPPS